MHDRSSIHSRLLCEENVAKTHLSVLAIYFEGACFVSRLFTVYSFLFWIMNPMSKMTIRYQSSQMLGILVNSTDLFRAFQWKYLITSLWLQDLKGVPWQISSPIFPHEISLVSLCPRFGGSFVIRHIIYGQRVSCLKKAKCNIKLRIITTSQNRRYPKDFSSWCLWIILRIFHLL